jgi:hypothetical protein
MKTKSVRLTLIITTDNDTDLIAYLNRLPVNVVQAYLREAHLIQDDEYLAQKWADQVRDLPTDVAVFGEGQ